MMVAIIDDGIDVEMNTTLAGKVELDLEVKQDGQILKRCLDKKILTDHGTTCAGIISKYAPEAKFCSLRIFHDGQLRTSCKMLLAALKWCFDNGVPIVHLSIGSGFTGDYREIRKIISQMIKRQQLVVAAHSVKERYSLPACIGGVFGVVADRNMVAQEYVFVEKPIDYHLIKASSNHGITLSEGCIFTTQITNSYSAPTVTAHIYNLVSQRALFSWTVAQVFADLQKDANTIRFIKPDFVGQAYIWNPSGYPILRQHLFFDCVGEGEFLADGKGYDLICLVPSDGKLVEQLDSFLWINRHRYSALVYGGRMASARNLVKLGKLVWSEDVYHQGWYESCEAQGGGQCPVVYIHGSGLGVVDLLCRLRERFLQEGYQCVGVCDQPFSYLYGLEYVPEAIKGDVARKSIEIMHDPDIMICCLAEDMHELSAKNNSNIYHIFTDRCHCEKCSQEMSFNLNHRDFMLGLDSDLELYAAIIKYFV